jgi:hypothetical protein
MNESLNLSQDPQKIIVSLATEIVALKEKISTLEASNLELESSNIALKHLLSLVLIEDGTLVDPADQAKRYCNVCKIRHALAVSLIFESEDKGWYCATCGNHFKTHKKHQPPSNSGSTPWQLA